jgi:hypothetical protein
MNPFSVLVDIVPVTARKYIYAAFALAVLQQAICAIVGWNTGAEGEVLTYLGGLLGVVAASNTTASKPEPYRLD